MRKEIYRFISIIGTCLVSTGAIQAASPASYLKFDAGVNFAQDISINGFDIEMDPGFRVGIAPGVILNDLLAVELETGFIYNEPKASDEWLGHVPLLVNFILQHDFDFGLTPFGGVGLGGTLSIIEAEDGFGGSETDTTFAFAWQAQAGLRYRLNDQASIGAVYKYLGVNDPEFNLFGIDFEVENVHNHYIGVQFNFNF